MKWLGQTSKPIGRLYHCKSLLLNSWKSSKWMPSRYEIQSTIILNPSKSSSMLNFEVSWHAVQMLHVQGCIRWNQSKYSDNKLCLLFYMRQFVSTCPYKNNSKFTHNKPTMKHWKWLPKYGFNKILSIVVKPHVQHARSFE